MQTPEDMSVTPAAAALMARLQPLLDGGRLENLVDVLALVSDMTDLLDAAMVEKLARLFETATAASWTACNTLRLAQAETAALPESPSLYSLFKLLNDTDTRKGVAVVLKTLNVIGRQM